MKTNNNDEISEKDWDNIKITEDEVKEAEINEVQQLIDQRNVKENIIDNLQIEDIIMYLKLEDAKINKYTWEEIDDKIEVEEAILSDYNGEYLPTKIKAKIFTKEDLEINILIKINVEIERGLSDEGHGPLEFRQTTLDIQEIYYIEPEED